MAYNLFRGGFLHVKSHPLKYLPINIFLGKSDCWKNGIITLEGIPLYRLSPTIDNYIELKKVDHYYYGDHHYYGLSVNNRIIYKKKYIFDYNVKVELMKNEKNIPYASFFKYY